MEIIKLFKKKISINKNCTNYYDKSHTEPIFDTKKKRKKNQTLTAVVNTQSYSFIDICIHCIL